MTDIRIKPTKVRRPARPRTCCPTHNDRCQFGRPHTWCWGNYIDGVWVASSMICGNCGARCQDEEIEMDFAEIGRQAYRNGEPFIAADSDTGRAALITVPRGSQAAAAREYAEGWRTEQRDTNPAEYLTGEVQTAERLVTSLTMLIGKTTHARHLKRLRADRVLAEQDLSRLVTDLGAAVQEQPQWLTNDLGTHRPIDKMDLGYTRRICAACGMDWSCPDAVQAREERIAQEQIEYERTHP